MMINEMMIAKIEMQKLRIVTLMIKEMKKGLIKSKEMMIAKIEI